MLINSMCQEFRKSTVGTTCVCPHGVWDLRLEASKAEGSLTHRVTSDADYGLEPQHSSHWNTCVASPCGCLGFLMTWWPASKSEHSKESQAEAISLFII